VGPPWTFRRAARHRWTARAGRGRQAAEQRASCRSRGGGAGQGTAATGARGQGLGGGGAPGFSVGLFSSLHRSPIGAKKPQLDRWRWGPAAQPARPRRGPGPPPPRAFARPARSSLQPTAASRARRVPVAFTPGETPAAAASWARWAVAVAWRATTAGSVAAIVSPAAKRSSRAGTARACRAATRGARATSRRSGAKGRPVRSRAATAARSWAGISARASGRPVAVGVDQGLRRRGPLQPPGRSQAVAIDT
jgi:hypothetical protein